MSDLNVAEPGTLETSGSASASAASWGAILAGAAVAAALSLILLSLGGGLGFASVSPWAGNGMSASGFGVAAAVWLLIVQGASAALGGYVAGRLRTRWTDVHSHEVYFRDTAHGFLAWAVATLLSASLLASAAGSIVSGVGAGAARLGGGLVMAGGAAAGGAAAGGVAGMGGPGNAEPAGLADPNAYFSDTLLRSNKGETGGIDQGQRAEIGRIVARSLTQNGVSAEDKMYLSQVVAARSGVGEQEANQRVDQVIAQAHQAADEAAAKAKQAADAARKAAAGLSLWIFIALLTGAFLASLLATMGGRARDRAALRV